MGEHFFDLYNWGEFWSENRRNHPAIAAGHSSTQAQGFRTRPRSLLANALRHTPHDGSVAVVLTPGGDWRRRDYRGLGGGIDEVDLERAFERYRRADAARGRDGHGAGLGLAISRGLVEAQGGRIWAERGAGGGARISLVLPAGASGA